VITPVAESCTRFVVVSPAAMAEVKSMALLATPFIVAVKALPDVPKTLVLIIGAPILVTPFTVTVEVLAVEAFETSLTASDVEDMPFTFEVKVLPNKLKLLVVPAASAGVRSNAVLATPFTVVVKLVPVSEVSLVLTIGAPVLVTPFTVTVEVLTEEAFETSLTASDVEDIPFTFEVKVLPNKLKLLVVPAASAGVRSKAVLATPFTVVVKLVPVSEVSLVLIIGTAVPGTPFTVVLKLFPVDVFDTVVAAVIPDGVNKAPPSVPIARILSASTLLKTAV
jgi:predicted lipid carrier protein YhbT